MVCELWILQIFLETRPRLLELHSYRIASADCVLAALHAGYRLPTAPNSTATPMPNSTSSGVMDTEIEADEAEPRDMPVEETVYLPLELDAEAADSQAMSHRKCRLLYPLRLQLSSTVCLQA